MSLTPVQALLRGALAGAAGTVAMDVLGYARSRRHGGEQRPLQWEFGGASTWDADAAPAQVSRRLSAALAPDLMGHLAYGTTTALAFRVLT
jgi:hypothetical protein